MPTAARLAAAIGFAAVACFAAELYKPGLPPETQWGRFTLLTTLIGLVCGWRVMGRLAGRGNTAAMGYGVRTSATIAVLALLVFSIYEMVGQALRKRYDGVMDALVGILELMLEFGTALARPEPLAVLVLGGIGAGLLAEWAGRQWR